MLQATEGGPSDIGENVLQFITLLHGLEFIMKLYKKKKKEVQKFTFRHQKYFFYFYFFTCSINQTKQLVFISPLPFSKKK